MVKTNAMRILEKADIAYSSVTYECGSDDLIGLHAAEQIKVITPAQCFKTLVGRGAKSGVLVFCVPVTGELDLKEAASAAGDKKVELIHVKELQGLTGYIRGGCSPIGMKKTYPTFVDASALRYDRIGVSGGMRGLQVILDPHALGDLVGAKFCDLSR